MDLTKSQNPDSIVLSSAKIEITKTPVSVSTVAGKKIWTLTDLLDLGLARGVKISPSSTKFDIKADNGTVPVKGYTDGKYKVEFSLLERHLPRMGQIMAGAVTVTPEIGDLMNAVEDFAVGAATLGKHIPFAKQNAGGDRPTAVLLTQVAGGTLVTLVDGVDYIVTEYAGAWYWVLFSDAGLWDETKAIKVAYTVTPAKSYKLSRGSSGVIEGLGIRLTNKRKSIDGRTITRIFELPYGVYDGEDSITFKGKSDGDNAAEVPMSFEFTPHPDLALISELAGESLYREIQEV